MTSTTDFRVDPSNTEQLRAWDGDEGTYWAEHAELFDRAVHAFQPAFLESADISEDAEILDIGCGSGECTLEAAALAPSGSALGVDLSAAMLEVARSRATAQGRTNVAFIQADAQIHPFEPASFDRVVSRTGATFFGTPSVAFANLAHATRPGGRLALMVWQDFRRNEWVREFFTALAAGRDLGPPPPNAPGPFSLADPDRIRDLLTSSGWSAPTIDAMEESMYFGASADQAYGFILGLLEWLLEELDAEGRTRAKEALRATCQQHATNDGVLYDATAWLVTAVRR